MHRIRLHGPWIVRLVKKTNSLVDSTMTSARDLDLMEADRVPAASVLSGVIPPLEETIELPQEWDRWRSSQSVGPDQAYELGRAFGKPTGLVAGQEVWLVLIGQLACKVWLNDSRLISDPPSDLECNPAGEFRFPIGSQLLARNRLRLLIENAGSDLPSGCVLQSVYLEIEEP